MPNLTKTNNFRMGCPYSLIMQGKIGNQSRKFGHYRSKLGDVIIDAQYGPGALLPYLKLSLIHNGREYTETTWFFESETWFPDRSLAIMAGKFQRRVFKEITES